MPRKVLPRRDVPRKRWSWNPPRGRKGGRRRRSEKASRNKTRPLFFSDPFFSRVNMLHREGLRSIRDLTTTVLAAASRSFLSPALLASRDTPISHGTASRDQDRGVTDPTKPGVTDPTKPGETEPTRSRHRAVPRPLARPTPEEH